MSLEDLKGSIDEVKSILESGDLQKMFDPSQPRGKDGRWIELGDIEAAAGNKKKEDALRAKVDDPKELKKLNSQLKAAEKSKGGDKSKSKSPAAGGGYNSHMESFGKIKNDDDLAKVATAVRKDSSLSNEQRADLQKKLFDRNEELLKEKKKKKPMAGGFAMPPSPKAIALEKEIGSLKVTKDNLAKVEAQIASMPERDRDRLERALENRMHDFKNIEEEGFASPKKSTANEVESLRPKSRQSANASTDGGGPAFPPVIKPGNKKPSMVNIGSKKYPMMAKGSDGKTVHGYVAPVKDQFGNVKDGDHMLAHNGMGWNYMGTGKNLKTGEPMHSYESGDGDGEDHRIWVSNDGKITEDY